MRFACVCCCAVRNFFGNHVVLSVQRNVVCVCACSCVVVLCEVLFVRAVVTGLSLCVVWFKFV